MQVIKVDMTEADTRRAKELGITLEEYRRQIAEHYKKHWCSCPVGKDAKVPWIFHDDGRRTNQHCPKKHHYHCPKCKKLTQVG